MFARSSRIFVLVGFVLAVVTAATSVGSPAPTAYSQDDDTACQSLVMQAMRAVSSACTNTGRNEACFGHTQIQARYQPGVGFTPFGTSGDKVPLINLSSLVTLPANPEAGIWGVAVMQVQADLPDTTTEDVTMVLFGDTSVENLLDPTAPQALTCDVTNPGTERLSLRRGPAEDTPLAGYLEPGQTLTVIGRSEAADWVWVRTGTSTAWVPADQISMDCPVESLAAASADSVPPNHGPMQAINLRTGAPTTCETAPNGLLVRSPTGSQVSLYVNGVLLEMSSGAFLTATEDDKMTVTATGGVVKATASMETVALAPLQSAEIPLSGLNPSGPPLVTVELFEVQEVGENEARIAADLVNDVLPPQRQFTLFDLPQAADWDIVRNTLSATGGYGEQFTVGDVQESGTWTLTFNEDRTLVTVDQNDGTPPYNLLYLGGTTFGSSFTAANNTPDGQLYTHTYAAVLAFTSPSTFSAPNINLVEWDDCGQWTDGLAMGTLVVE